jgi:hypothetical protein
MKRLQASSRNFAQSRLADAFGNRGNALMVWIGCRSAQL